MKKTHNIKISNYFVSILSLILCFNLTLLTYAEIETDFFNHVYRHRNIVEDKLLNDNNINFEEIDDLIFNYNPTVKNIWNNFEVNKETDDIADDYYEAADDLEGMSGDNDVLSAQLSAQAKGLRVAGDNNVIDSNINYLNNLKIEKTLALDTKINMVNYHKSIIEKIKSEKSLEEINRNLNSANLNFENGNLTKSELLKIKSNYKKIEADLIISESNVKNYKRNVLINCGYNMDDNVSIAETPHVDINIASNINYKNDIQDAIQNNIQYEIYKRSLENSKSTEMKNTNKINVDNAERFIENDLETKSRNIVDAIAIYDASILNKNNIYNTYIADEKKYNEGSISKKEFQTSKYNYEVSNYDIDIAKYNIDIAYLTYVEAVNGLANAGTQ